MWLRTTIPSTGRPRLTASAARIRPQSTSFGFRLRRVGGSHYIYTHPQVPRPLSRQPRNREAKPYQISQFLDMVREFGLTIEHRR